MRIPIREQLAALVLLAVLVALAIVSIPTWLYVHNFVVDVRTQGLTLTASLKAAQIASDLDLLQSICGSITTRLFIQQSLLGTNISQDQQTLTSQTLQTGLVTSGFVDLLQGRIYSNDTRSPNGSKILYESTRDDGPLIELPWTRPNGTSVYLGDDDLGFPPMLYPNLTYGGHDNPAMAFPDVPVSPDRFLLLGPLRLNDSYALISLTLPIVNIRDADNIIGYLTVVSAANSLFRLQTSPEGIGSTGQTLLLGPATPWNRFNSSYPLETADNDHLRQELGAAPVGYVLPPVLREGQEDRHSTPLGEHLMSFPLSQYPVALDSYATRLDTINNASGTLHTTNEVGTTVSVGYARPKTTLVDWMVIVEQSENEAYSAIVTLRKILIACVLGTVGLILLVITPLSHYSVLPILKLKAATESTIPMPGYGDDVERQSCGDQDGVKGRKKSWIRRLRDFYAWKKQQQVQPEGPRHDNFRIPRKVKVKPRFISDELTELTTTFNEMSDELLLQYRKLEDKVNERTKELQLSKKAAEVANEAKTVFIANISHELKTPLNGILGMCAVCMEETDPNRNKQSLAIMYESGILLLRLLEDLLYFSKHQVIKAPKLAEETFRLGDLGDQIRALFGKQAAERGTALSVTYSQGRNVNASAGDMIKLFRNDQVTATGGVTKDAGVDNTTITDTRGRFGSIYTATLSRDSPFTSTSSVLEEAAVFGDKHRLLQILLNLVSNSLKFTKEGEGVILVRIKCSIVESKLLMRDSHAVGSQSVRSKSSSKSRPEVSAQRVPSRTQSLTSPQQRAASSSTYETDIPSVIEVVPTEQQPQDERRLSESSSRSRPSPTYYDAFLEIEVQDNGGGIPADVRGRVFEPFVQGENGLRKSHGGAGLGLTICKQLAQLMKGDIWFKSTQNGQGTTFTVCLPMKVLPASSQSSHRKQSIQVSATDKVSLLDIDDHTRGSRTSSDANKSEASASVDARLMGPDVPQTPDSGRGISILVVDDNATNRAVCVRMLRVVKILSIATAEDGEEAYTMVKQSMEKGQPYDMVLMDIMMPRMDGIQSSRLIRQLGFAAPIIACTAFDLDHVLTLDAGSVIDMYMTKPLKMPEVHAALKKYLGVSVPAKRKS